VLFTLAASLFLPAVAAPVREAHPGLFALRPGGVLLGNVIRITLGAWLEFSQGIDILSGCGTN